MPTTPLRSANLTILDGVLSSEPRHRELPSGDAMISYEVTTETETGRLTVPVVWFSPRRPPSVDLGDPVFVAGVVRRRFFRYAGGAASRTEVVADLVSRPSAAAAQRVRERLGELFVDGNDDAAA